MTRRSLMALRPLSCPWSHACIATCLAHAASYLRFTWPVLLCICATTILSIVKRLLSRKQLSSAAQAIHQVPAMSCVPCRTMNTDWCAYIVSIKSTVLQLALSYVSTVVATSVPTCATSCYSTVLLPAPGQLVCSFLVAHSTQILVLTPTICCRVQFRLWNNVSRGLL